MIKLLRSVGISSEVMYVSAMLSIGASIFAWATAKNKSDRPEAERWGIFIGLWAPTFMEIGNALKTEEKNL